MIGYRGSGPTWQAGRNVELKGNPVTSEGENFYKERVSDVDKVAIAS